MELWAEHFKDQFSRPMVTMDILLLSAREPVQMNTGTPSKMEVVKEIGCLRRL